MTQLSFYYPKAYLRLLQVSLVGLLAMGTYSLGHHTKRPATEILSFNTMIRRQASSARVSAAPAKTVLAKTDAAASSSPTLLPPYNAGTSSDPLIYARHVSALKFGDRHWPALQNLWQHESGWNPTSLNYSSGACGIPQALPCWKITDQTTKGQVDWGLSYIASRYGNPTSAWRFWQVHNWY